MTATKHKCTVCANRVEEIRRLEERIAMLSGLVEACPALTQDDDYWASEPVRNQAVAEWASREGVQR